MQITVRNAIIHLSHINKCGYAEIAQSVEHFTRNEGVVGSSPIFSCKGVSSRVL